MQHSILIDILLIISSIYLGINITYLYIKRTYRKELEKRKNETKEIYKEIFDNVSDKKVNFLYRINNTVKFETTTKKLGDISVYFYLSKTEIIIYKNEEAILTSNELETNFLNELDYLLKVTLSNKINDTVILFGSIFSRNYFNSTFSVNLEKFEFTENSNQLNEGHEDYDIDSILDKINIIGYNKLSSEEKEFLKKYSNE